MEFCALSDSGLGGVLVVCCDYGFSAVSGNDYVVTWVGECCSGWVFSWLTDATLSNSCESVISRIGYSTDLFARSFTGL